MAGQQSQSELIGNMIPGVPVINWLNHLGEGYNPQNPQVAAQQAQQMQRARIGYGIQQQRVAQGLAPHSPTDLNAAIDAQIAAMSRPLQAQPPQPGNALRQRAH